MKTCRYCMTLFYLLNTLRTFVKCVSVPWLSWIIYNVEMFSIKEIELFVEILITLMNHKSYFYGIDTKYWSVLLLRSPQLDIYRQWKQIVWWSLSLFEPMSVWRTCLYAPFNAEHSLKYETNTMPVMLFFFYHLCNISMV